MPDPIHWFHGVDPDTALPAPRLLWPADLAVLCEGEDDDLGNRFGVSIDLGGPRTVVAASLGRLERWCIEGLTAVENARASVTRAAGPLALWATSHPAVLLLDAHEPGLLWARTTIGDVPAPETAVCWQHLDQTPRVGDYDDLPERAPLGDHSGYEGLACIVCGRDVAELVDALQRDDRPSDIAAGIAAATLAVEASDSSAPEPVVEVPNNASVAIDEGPAFPCVDDGGRWNGAVCPRFTRRTAERVIDWMVQEQARRPAPEDMSFTWDGDTIVIHEGAHVDDLGYAPIRVAPDGSGRYRLGSGWCWSPADHE